MNLRGCVLENYPGQIDENCWSKIWGYSAISGFPKLEGYYSINHQSSRQIVATSAEVNPNDGRGREFPQNELNSGRGIMVIWWNSDQSCIKILLNFGNKLILKGQLVLQQIHFATKTNHFGTNIWYYWNRISQQLSGLVAGGKNTSSWKKFCHPVAMVNIWMCILSKISFFIGLHTCQVVEDFPGNIHQQYVFIALMFEMKTSLFLFLNVASIGNNSISYGKNTPRGLSEGSKSWFYFCKGGIILASQESI